MPRDIFISIGGLISAWGVSARMENFDFEVILKINSFKVELLINNILSEYHCTGNRFSEDVLRAIVQMKEGDRIC